MIWNCGWHWMFSVVHTRLWRWVHAARRWPASLSNPHGNRLRFPLHRCADWSSEFFYLCTLSPICCHSNPSTHCKSDPGDNRFWLALHQCPHSRWRPDCPNRLWAVHSMRSDATQPNRRVADGKANQQRVRWLCERVLHQGFATPFIRKKKSEERQTFVINQAMHLEHFYSQ